MKFSLSLLALFVGFVAHAQSESPYIKFLGRGLLDRGTGESIALACKTIECKEVGLLYASKTQNLSWVGASFPMPVYTGKLLQDDPEVTKLLEWAIRVELQYFLMKRNPKFVEEEGKRTYRRDYYLPFGELFKRKRSHYEGLFGKVAFDQNGWNWVAQAKRTNTEIVQRYIAIFKHGTIIGIEDRSNAGMDIMALKADCYRDGIRFHDDSRIFVRSDGKSNYDMYAGIDFMHGKWFTDDVKN